MWKNRSHLTHYMLIALFSFLVVSSFFCFLYLCDNKYTLSAPSGADGVLQLPDNVPDRLLVPLIDGWEFYPGELITPQDFERGIASAPMPASIRQTRPHVPSLPGRASIPPHGSGTYRLRIRHRGEPIILRLDLPHIFNVSAVWIDGKVMAPGDPSLPSYQPYIKGSMETFLLAGECEIVVQCGNNLQYYSGMLSAPMLGTPRAMDALLTRQQIFYGFLFFSSIAIALFLFAVWIKLVHDQIYRYFGIMTLCFAISVSYPFWHHLQNNVLRFVLIMQSFSSLGVMLCVCIINHVALGVSSKNLFYRATLGLGITACACAVLFPLFVFPAMPAMISVYTTFLDIYCLVLCAFMVYAVAHALRSHPVMAWIIPGNITYGLGLMLSVLSTRYFDPVFGGWPMEYCGFAMVVLFTVMVIRYSRSVLHENDKLNAHLEEEVVRRTAQISNVLQERKRFLSSFAHDLKAPVSAIQTYMELIHMGHIHVDSELERYLKVIEQKSTDMQRRVEALQLFSAHADSVYSDCERIDLSELLQEIYQNNLPDAEASGVYFKLCLPDEDAYIVAWRDKLSSAIENILYNAISFMPDGGILMLAVFCHDSWVNITISDTGVGIPPEHLPHVFDEHFSTRSEEQDYPTFKRGLGLYLAQTTVRELNGEITVYSDWGNGAEFNIQLPLVK